MNFVSNQAVLGCALLISLSVLSIAGNAADVVAKPVAGTTGALRLHGRTEIPGYTGDFDHFGVDIKGNRLFLAAEDHGTLEVFDLDTGKHRKTVTGVESPHGILYLADKNRLIITDSGAGFTKVLDATTYKVLSTIKLALGADSMAYDPSGKYMYVSTGGKNGKLAQSYLAKIDPRTGKQLGELTFDTDKIEAAAIEQKGKYLFLNVTGKNEVAVIDKEKFTVVKTFPVKDGELNAAMAFDEANARLFIVTRKPFKLVVVNSKTGATVASFAAPNRTNEIMFDQKNRRIYLAGDNVMAVFQQNDADHYQELAPLATAVGAKTAILIPEKNRLVVAVSPGDEKTGAALLWLDVTPAGIALR